MNAKVSVLITNYNHAGCLLLGYIESIFKIREYEQENTFMTNPEWSKLAKDIDAIKEGLNLLTNKKI